MEGVTRSKQQIEGRGEEERKGVIRNNGRESEDGRRSRKVERHLRRESKQPRKKDRVLLQSAAAPQYC